jgi:hypothetical protein
VEPVGPAAHRFVLEGEDGRGRSSVPFTIAGADEEDAFGLATLGDALVLVLGLYAERLALAVVDIADVVALVGADRRSLQRESA